MTDAKKLKRGYLKICLLAILGLLGFKYQLFGLTANGTGAWENTGVWTTTPDAGTLSGSISWYSVLVSGNITRNGNLIVGNSLEVSAGATLTILGDVTGSNSIKVNSGSVLYITGNLTSSGMNITVENGGTMVVLGNTTLSGGNLVVFGDYITLGNFSLTSIGATIKPSGNLVIGGDFNFGGGSINIDPTPSASQPIYDNIYFIKTSPTITQPSYSPICTNSTPSCRYGTAADLLLYDPALAAYVSSLLIVPPTSNISGPSTICNGSSAAISVALTGTAPWKLTYYDGSSSTSITGILTSPYVFNVTPVSSISYTITALSDSKSSATAANMTGIAAITVKNRPASTVSGSNTICSGSSTPVQIALTGTSPWGLTYSNGSSSTSVTGITSSLYSLSALSNATYTVTALTDANCSAQTADITGSAVIVVNGRPTSVISGSASICSGSSTNISIALNGSGPWNLTYSDGSVSQIVNNVNTNPYTFSVTPSSIKTYKVTALSDTKCSAMASDLTGSATVTINIPASAAVLSGTATICKGNSTNLKIAVTGGTSPYTIALSDASLTTGYVSGSNIVKSPTATTTYSLTTVQDANNCFSTGLSGSALVNVITTPAQPSIIVPASTLACQNSTGSYTVTNDPVVVTYNWSYSGTNVTLLPSGNTVSIVFGVAATSGTLTVTGTNSCGTSTASSLAIVVNPNITPAVSIAVSPSGASCFGNNLTYTATPVNGGVPVYQWYLNSTAVGTNSNVWSSVYILNSDIVKCVMTSSLCSNALTNPATSNAITTVVNKDIINLTSVSTTTLCAGSGINVNFTTPCNCTNSPVNSFIVQLSNASGSFSSPVNIGTLTAYLAGTYTINAIIPTSTATGSGYLIRVISSSASLGTGISASSAAITVSSSTGTPIVPTIYGNGVWNVFCYNGNTGFGVASGASSPGSVNTYLGYYTENNLSFDSRTRWATGTSPTTANTSSGSGYIGCASLSYANIYLSFKRTNIPCGNYRMDIPYHDDAYEIYIDGVRQNYHNGCCDSHTGVWTGWIGPSNLVEFRLFQGSGGSGLQVAFTSISLLSVSANPTVCSGASTTLVASGGGASVNYTWSPSTFLSTSTGATVTSTPTATTSYTVNATDSSSGCSSTANVTVNVSSTINLVLTNLPVSTNSCQGITSNVLTASGANTYTWSPATGLNTTSGPVVTANPGTNVTYTVTGNNGCTTASKSISFIGQIPGDSLNYAPGSWYALCYDTTLFNKYYGYYIESGLSFNTTSKWLSNKGPATAANSTYNGCYMNDTYYSIRLKRTGVPCGYYSVNIENCDDYVWLFVDGVKVFYGTYSTVNQPNVWTGFIGPSTMLEFRLINYSGPGNLKVTFVPVSGIANLSTPPTVCAGTSTTISTATITGDSYSWSSSTGKNSWLSTTTGATTIVTPPVSTPNGSHYFVRTLVDGTTGCSVKDSLLVTVNPLSNTTVSPSDTTVYCSLASVTLKANGASTYTWTPTTGLSAATGSMVTATPGVSTTYTVSGNNNCNTKDVTAKITVVPLIADNIFPTGKWNVYGYNTTSWTGYMGYYTTNGSGTTGYDFDTRTQWTIAQGVSNATATGGTAYIGCSIGVDNFTTSFKRTGIICGFYQIDMVYQDDAAELWVDGAKVWSNNSYSSVLQSNIWSGYLTTTSTLEFRHKEYTGSGGLAVQFTKKVPVFTSITVSPLTGICSGGAVSATLTAAATGIGNTYTWSPVLGLSSTTGATTTALPTVSTKYYVRVSNCSGSVYGDTAITVTVLQPSIINTQPTPQTICENSNTSFSISSSNTLGYQWEYSSNGGVSWANVVDGGIYSGATTQTLNLTNVTYSNNNYRYRCRTTNYACSTEFSSAALLTVNQKPVNPASISGISAVCKNSTGIAYSVSSVSLATSYYWVLPLGATIASGTGTNNITVNFGTTSGNVTVVGVNVCGNSAVASVFPVNVNSGVPADPGSITGSFSVCKNTVGVVYTVPSIVDAASYTWTVPTGASITAGATTNSITVSFGASAISGNITVTGVNPCGTSINVSSFPVILNSTIPGNPVVITGSNSLCSGSSSSYSLGLVTGATGYAWTLPTGSSITSGTGTNNVTIQFGAVSGTITAYGTNGCGSSAIPATLSVSVSSPLLTAPGTIVGSNSVCKGVFGISYVVPALVGASSYTWSLPVGASLTSGSATQSIMVSYGASAVNGDVTVFGSNICGDSPSSLLAVSVNTGVPNNPGSITGITTVCKNSTGKIYSISPVTGATSYNWTLPTGASISAGSGTSSITVAFGASATSGTLSVVGVNGCGVSSTPATMFISTIGAVPNQPPAFTASSLNVCLGQSNVIYTIPNDLSIVSYSWNYSGSGASYSSIINSVSISYSASASSGTLSVVGNNDCGTGIARTIAVVVDPTPVITPGIIPSVCKDANSFSLPYTTFGSPVTYSISVGLPAMPGFTSVVNAALSGSPIGVTIPTSGVSANTYSFNISVTNAHGCISNNTTFNLVVNPFVSTGPVYRVPNN